MQSAIYILYTNLHTVARKPLNDNLRPRLPGSGNLRHRPFPSMSFMHIFVKVNRTSLFFCTPTFTVKSTPLFFSGRQWKDFLLFQTPQYYLSDCTVARGDGKRHEAACKRVLKCLLNHQPASLRNINKAKIVVLRWGFQKCVMKLRNSSKLVCFRLILLLLKLHFSFISRPGLQK